MDLVREPPVFRRPRTTFFRRSRLPQAVRLRLTVPPLLAPCDARALARELQERVAAREAAIRDRMEAPGRRFMGALNVM